ncbi:MAG: glutamate mutase L [Chloroflexia bacterium]|nr:glutamate mutase L [Chloroflexia bacterium]
MVSYQNAEVGGATGRSTADDYEQGATTLGSGLVIDVDRHSVRAVLFDTVGGHGRFVTASVCASTVLPPIADPSTAIRQAIRAVEQDTGMTLLGDHGVQSPRQDHSGADFIALTGQPAPPVRLAFVPIGNSALATTLVAAARRTVSIVNIFDSNVRTDDGTLSGSMLESSIRAFQPDAVVILDGDNTQSEWATAVGTLSSLSAEGTINQIIIVARDQYQQQAAQTMGEDADLRGIDPGEFSPADIAAAIELELHSLYEARVDAPSMIASDQSVTVVGRARAGDLVTQFLARRREQTVTVVTVGDGTIIHSASPDSSLIGMRPEVDAHANIRSALRRDARHFLRWLPFSMSEEELNHWILNRALRPSTMSDTPRDRLIESAVVTEALRLVWEDLAPTEQRHHDLIVGGALFATWDSPGLALLSILNALEPKPESGLVEVALDLDGLFHAAGAIGELSPALAADVVERDLLLPLASVIVVNGDVKEGDLAVRGTIASERGGSREFSVPSGSIHQLDLGADETAIVTINCEPLATVGNSEPGAEVVLGQNTRLRGGDLGIVIDARGRAPGPATDPSVQAARMSNWLSDLNAKEIAG